MRRFQTYGPSLVVLTAAALVLAAGPGVIRQMHTARTAAVVTLAQQRLDGENLLEQLNAANRAVADAVEPSVVYIEATLRGPEGRLARSTGSGWVFDETGHIITNAHVVQEMETINVQFSDGRLRRAQRIGADRWTDVAVLQVDANPSALFPARRATGEPVHQGDRVFAFGSPFGFKFSMSEGIVSGLGRHAAPGRNNQYTNFIQTDAAINPGNSGGPLVDVRGRVIGMNTAIITDSDLRRDRAGGVSGGISFAIPLDTIESVAEQLIDDGEIIKGFLGISLLGVDELSAGQRRARGLTESLGVYVNSVTADSPADEAGLQAGDLITAVEGQPTPTSAVLRSVIGNHRPGDTVQMAVVRDGEARSLEVTLGAARMRRDGQLVPVQGEPRIRR